MCPKTLISLMSMGDQCILASSLIDVWPSWACKQYQQNGLQILGREDLGKLMRVHLARLLPGGRIRVHRDRGRYAAEVKHYCLTYIFSSHSQGHCYRLSSTG